MIDTACASRVRWSQIAMMAVLALILPLTSTVFGSQLPDGNITFRDVVASGEAGVDYARARSDRDAIFDAIKAQPTYAFPQDVLATPIKPRGIPGIVVFDYDGDGALDLYVTNGPGRSNSLLRNLIFETGSVAFDDMAIMAGVDASAFDCHGAVAGDLDNDGDMDLYVLADAAENLLFRNNGDGTFTDITAESGTGGGVRTSSSATLGDIDSDGLLDIFVGNSADLDDQTGILEPFPASLEPNLLLRNRGGMMFEDVSETSGIRTQAGLTAGFETTPTLTHAVAMVDIDRDGDIDILTADDQAAVTPEVLGGFDRGVIHLFRNDGTGHFVDDNVAAGIDLPAAWMGLTLGDFDHNGVLDFYASNFGVYALQLFPFATTPGMLETRWFLGTESGAFQDPGVGGLGRTVFGWGTCAADFDNDGDTDLVSHGGLDAGPLVIADNPGVMLINDGNAQFRYVGGPFAESTNHSRRNVQGVAIGDLDRNGFVDIVSVSNFDAPPPVPLAPFAPEGGVFDDTAFFIPTFLPTETPGIFVFNEDLPPLTDGSLSIELSNGNNNGWLAVSLQGSVGLTERGRVNRNGIGSVVSFRPQGGKTALRPVIAGASYASQDSLTTSFGLGSAAYGRVEVLWPGGVRNRLYGASHGERIRFPEIPVSFDDPTLSFGRYLLHAKRALRDLRRRGEISRFEEGRFFFSAFVAYLDERF